jgi:hypothetical protein
MCAIHDDHLAARRKESTTIVRPLRLAAMDGEAVLAGLVMFRST